MKESGRFPAQKSRFSLQIVRTPSCHDSDSQVKNSASYQGPNSTADGGVNSSRSGTSPEVPADVKVSKSLFAQGLDENAMIADEERVFMHRPYARVSRSERALENY
jgi:hypothetical protein